MLRFCSLNKVELAQTLFLCILRIRDSSTYHYIRYYELGEFFAPYKSCPVRSFDTADINFDLLPTRRYYASDFSELLMRYPVLLHPMPLGIDGMDLFCGEASLAAVPAVQAAWA